MKKFLLVSAVILAVFSVSTSCQKDPAPTYPQTISGCWTYVNASTGYSAVLYIEDIAGGQYGYFTYFDPTYTTLNYTEGSFVYDSSTGVGTVSSLMTGGVALNIKAYSDDNTKIYVSATQVVSGGSAVVMEGDFTASGIISFSTGNWEMSETKKVGGIEYEITYILDITSLKPTSGSCGTLKFYAKQKGASGEEETSTTTITSISEFYRFTEQLAVGSFRYRTEGSKLDELMMVCYNPVSKDVTMYDDNGESISLKATNIN